MYSISSHATPQLQVEGLCDSERNENEDATPQLQVEGLCDSERNETENDGTHQCGEGKERTYFTKALE